MNSGIVTISIVIATITSITTSPEAAILGRNEASAQRHHSKQSNLSEVSAFPCLKVGTDFVEDG